MEKETKTSRLKRMYFDLRCGAIIEVNGCRIFRSTSIGRDGRDRELLYWRHFGQSAESCTLEDLRWICKVIAKSEDYNYKIIDHQNYQ